MKTKPTLELRDVENGLKAGLVKAAEKGWAVTVSVVDDGGHLLGLKRMDGCAAVAAYISPEKARTAALGQRGSGGYEKMINDGRTAFLCVDVLKGTLEGGAAHRHRWSGGWCCGGLGREAQRGPGSGAGCRRRDRRRGLMARGAWGRPSGSWLPGCHAAFGSFSASLRPGGGARLHPTRRGLVV